MQESFWWWQCSDRHIISPPSPNLRTPFSPSLISLMVSVDVKHHVYLALPTDISYRKSPWLRADRKSGAPVRQPPARCATPFTGLSWHGSLAWLPPCCSISGVAKDFKCKDVFIIFGVAKDYLWCSVTSHGFTQPTGYFLCTKPCVIYFGIYYILVRVVYLDAV